MKKLCLVWLATALTLLAQGIDWSALDKLAEKAKKSAVVNLGPEQLSLIAGLRGQAETDKLGELAKKLRSVQVRSFEFDAPGMYDMGLLRTLRDKIKASGEWTSIVSVTESGGASANESKSERNFFTEILIKRGSAGGPGGLLILAAEPKEVSVVHVEGLSDLSALRNLGALPGLPGLANPPKKSSAPSSERAPGKFE